MFNGCMVVHFKSYNHSLGPKMAVYGGHEVGAILRLLKDPYVRNEDFRSALGQILPNICSMDVCLSISSHKTTHWVPRWPFMAGTKPQNSAAGAILRLLKDPYVRNEDFRYALGHILPNICSMDVCLSISSHKTTGWPCR